MSLPEPSIQTRILHAADACQAAARHKESAGAVLFHARRQLAAGTADARAEYDRAVIAFDATQRRLTAAEGHLASLIDRAVAVRGAPCHRK